MPRFTFQSQGKWYLHQLGFSAAAAASKSTEAIMPHLTEKAGGTPSKCQKQSRVQRQAVFSAEVNEFLTSLLEVTHVLSILTSAQKIQSFSFNLNL